MVAVGQLSIETAGGRLEYIDVGEGVPVLYFHGTGAGNDAAALLEESLLRDGCRLIIPNRPGYFGTALGPVGSTDFCTTLAASLLERLSTNRVIAIGTSGGGMPAAAFARRYPDHVAALILQCAQSHTWTSGKWLPDGLGPALFLFRHDIFLPFLRWQNTRSARRGRRQPVSCIRSMAGKRFLDLQNNPRVLHQVTALTEMTLRCAASPEGIQNDWAILTRDSGVSAHTINCPTLIIHDRMDPLVPFAHATWSHSCISESRLLPIHAGGHLIWYGREAAFMHRERMAFIHDALSA